MSEPDDPALRWDHPPHGAQEHAILSAASASLDALGNWPLRDRIGLYAEDAAVRFGPVSVVTSPGY